LVGVGIAHDPRGGVVCSVSGSIGVVGLGVGIERGRGIVVRDDSVVEIQTVSESRRISDVAGCSVG